MEPTTRDFPAIDARDVYKVGQTIEQIPITGMGHGHKAQPACPCGRTGENIVVFVTEGGEGLQVGDRADIIITSVKPTFLHGVVRRHRGASA